METNTTEKEVHRAEASRRPKRYIWLCIAILVITALAWSWDWLAAAGLLGVTLLLLGCLGMCMFGMRGGKGD